MFPTPTMYAINESPVGDLPLHFIPFPVRPISSSEMASEQKSRREGFGGSCALRPLVDIANNNNVYFTFIKHIVISFL